MRRRKGTRKSADAAKVGSGTVQILQISARSLPDPSAEQSVSAPLSAGMDGHGCTMPENHQKKGLHRFSPELLGDAKRYFSLMKGVEVTDDEALSYLKIMTEFGKILSEWKM